MDLILKNGKIITMSKMKPRAEAVAVKAGRIIKVGTNDEILLLKEPRTKIIDLKGKMVIPGFNESHVHLLNYGYSLQKVDCSDAKSVEEIIERGREYIRMHQPKPGEWILGRGWNQILFKEKRELTRHDLDQISTKHPISFTRICEHATVANSKAIELAGVTKDTLQPLGGRFDVDENGVPLGMFRETARYMIYDIIPDASVEEIKKMLLKAANIASSYGITSVQSDDFEALPSKDFCKVLQAYQELTKARKLPVRVYAQCLLPSIERLKSFLDLGYQTGQGDEYFKIGPLKLLTDGSLGARTAYLCAPYTDDPSTRGIPVFTQEELDELVITAHNGEMQVVTHAIGDGAMYMCFESFEKAQQQKTKKDPRFGIIHLQITDEILLNKFKEQNVVAYAEPICLNNDLHMAEDRVGKDRVKSAYNYKTLFNKDVHVCISSDCPVDSINAMKNIYVAVTRQDYDGYPEGGWFSEQKLTIDQVLYGFTMGSAYASFEEDCKGSIEEGKLADMAVLSEDIYEIDSNKIKDIKVEMTFMDGKLVYEKLS
ncbi:amidohydrolase [Clostridiaceae bacterium 35-E11]